jgi:hypothetical protein
LLRDAGTLGSAARYQPAAIVHHPQLDGGNDRHDDADHDANPSGA